MWQITTAIVLAARRNKKRKSNTHTRSTERSLVSESTYDDLVLCLHQFGGAGQKWDGNKTLGNFNGAHERVLVCTNIPFSVSTHTSAPLNRTRTHTNLKSMYVHVPNQYARTHYCVYTRIDLNFSFPLFRPPFHNIPLSYIRHLSMHSNIR